MNYRMVLIVTGAMAIAAEPAFASRSGDITSVGAVHQELRNESSEAKRTSLGPD